MKRTGNLLIFLILCISASYADAAGLKVHFIDVGEGDSILIETSGGKSILIDAGNLISGYRVVGHLKKNGIEKLDHLIFTHPHPDHMGGAFFILQMMEVKNIYDNGQDFGKGALHFDVYRWYADLVRGRGNYRTLQAGDSLLVDDIEIKVLWPYRPFESSDFNSNSLVIMVIYGKFRILLAGDIMMPAERNLLGVSDDLRADVLKVGHHGYASSTEEFLKRVSPEISVVSVNKNDFRGYPSAEVLKRLRDSGSKVYRTDEQGDIVISVTETGMANVKTLYPEGCSQCIKLEGVGADKSGG